MPYEIIKAIKEKSYNTIKYLIESGYDINEKDEYGWTALMYAVDSNDLKAVNQLIKQGAEINIQDIDGNTPLMLASFIDAREIEKILVFTENANINLKNNNGDTALDIARKDNSTQSYFYLSNLVRERENLYLLKRNQEIKPLFIIFLQSLLGETVELQEILTRFYKNYKVGISVEELNQWIKQINNDKNSKISIVETIRNVFSITLSLREKNREKEEKIKSFLRKIFTGRKAGEIVKYQYIQNLYNKEFKENLCTDNIEKYLNAENNIFKKFIIVKMQADEYLLLPANCNKDLLLSLMKNDNPKTVASNELQCTEDEIKQLNETYFQKRGCILRVKNNNTHEYILTLNDKGENKRHIAQKFSEKLQEPIDSIINECPEKILNITSFKKSFEEKYDIEITPELATETLEILNYKTKQIKLELRDNNILSTLRFSDVEKNKDLRCPICKVEFNKDEFKDHFTFHKNSNGIFQKMSDNKYICNNCGSEFSYTHSEPAHIIGHYEGRCKEKYFWDTKNKTSSDKKVYMGNANPNNSSFLKTPIPTKLISLHC